MLKHKDLINFTQNPFELFNNWYDLACETEINDPNAMTISTILNNKPSSRVVLLKSQNEKGFIFYTSQSSTASVRPFTGSRVGINSCPTNALYLISSNAFIIGG